MTQSLEDKIAAIRSLLPLIFTHRDFILGGAKTQRQEWVSERSHLDPAPLPPPTWRLDCDGHCHTCHVASSRECPPEEKWLRVYHGLRARYRIRDLEEALLGLSVCDAALAQAVWAVFVEPWPGEIYNPERPALGSCTEPLSWKVRLERAELAEEGLFWLAGNIEGDVRGEGDEPDPRENEIRRLASQGYPRRRIARELRCSLREVQRVLVPAESAGGV
jgi:hypothetical protein